MDKESKGMMKLSERIKRCLNRLNHLGYSSFQIKMIIREAIGTDCILNDNPTKSDKVLTVLEKYERLGSFYKETYSK